MSAAENFQCTLNNTEYLSIGNKCKQMHNNKQAKKHVYFFEKSAYIFFMALRFIDFTDPFIFIKIYFCDSNGFCICISFRMDGVATKKSAPKIYAILTDIQFSMYFDMVILQNIITFQAIEIEILMIYS